MIKSLYVHIPFCSHICGYCDFGKCRYEKPLADRYLDHLEKELSSIDQDSFFSIYIGGGTPTALDEVQLGRLLEMLARFKVEQEYTIEINPENLTLEKAQLMKQFGINRASIGLQTFDEGLLKVMGRVHSNKDVENTFEYLDKAGITNRSVDLMYGFQSQDLFDVLKDLNKAVQLNITHISIYDLEVYPKTPFGLKNYQKVDDETDYLMYSTIIDFLNEHSYKQYEVSNFALPHYQSAHNQVYWKYEDYYGAGLSAAGKIGTYRYENTRNFVKYLKDEYRGEENYLSLDDVRFEALMMNLRLLEGIDIKEYDDRFETNLLLNKHDAIEKNINHGLLKVENGHLKVTEKGIFVLNDIIVDFMD